VLLPPINGATAASGTPYFTENPGDPYKAWDASGTFDWVPSQYITFRWEYNHRAANVPYFSGPGGVTPPEVIRVRLAQWCRDGLQIYEKKREPAEYGDFGEVLVRDRTEPWRYSCAASRPT